MMLQNTFSIQLDSKQVENTQGILKAFGWTENDVNNPYTQLRMRSPNGSVATLYTSGKLVFQGKEDFTKYISSIKGNIQEKAELCPHLGVDEVGKGDYFGPLVVVSCFLDEDFLEKVSCIGVGDSKKFSDKRIMDMYLLLKDYPYYYASIIYPQEYNTLYSDIKNASVLLARQHSKVIEMGLNDLKAKNIPCLEVVIDQFSSRKDRILNELGQLGNSVNITQFHKGESDMAVAAASVIARGIFLEEFEKMNKQYNFEFPKGSSNVINQAKEFVCLYGAEELEKVAKTSFKTTEQILQEKF